MEIIFFFYNNIITVCYSICFAGFMILYFKHRSKSCLHVALVFLFFIFDNFIPYMNEFLPGITFQYLTSGQTPVSANPYLTNTIGFLIVLFYRLSLLSFQADRMTSREKVFWCLLLAVYLILSYFDPRFYFRLAMTIIRRTISVAVFSGAYFNSKKIADNLRLGLRKTRCILLISLLLQIAESIESLFPYLGINLLFDNRIIFTELIGLFFSVLALVYIVRELMTRSPSRESVSPDSSAVSQGVEEEFCDRYSLTPREREVLKLVVNGLSNEEIAQSLVVTQGTVKTHVHNIFQKLEVNNRLQLLRLLRDFK